MRPLLALLGPTASGKTEIALHVAERIGGVILSVDSMQVYRGMDIGTAKPSSQQRRRVPHLMIDVADPEETYSVARFRTEARRELARVGTRPVLVVGGSGLHFRAVVDPFRFPPSQPALRRAVEALSDHQARTELLEADPGAGDFFDLANRRRVVRAVEILRLTGETPSRRRAAPEGQALQAYQAEVPVVAVGIDPGERLRERITERLSSMVEAGLIEEVGGLAGRLGATARQAVGYKQLLPVVGGLLSVADGVAAARRATWRLARRQRTFFRRDPRIRWIPWADDPDQRRRLVEESLLEDSCVS